MSGTTCIERSSGSAGRRVLLMTVAVALLQVGCWKSPPAKVANAHAASKVASQATEGTTPPPAAKDSEQPEMSDASEAGSVSPAPADSKSQEAASAPQPPTPERILLFTPRGPLLVHLHILLDGQPQRVAADKWLARFVQAGEAARDVEVSWTDLVAQPRVARGRLGNTPLPGDKERVEAIRQFDRNRDGRAQMDELVAFFGRNTANQRPFSLLAVADSGNELQNGALYALFDVDRDGRLSGAEIEAAATRLQTRDADDNDVVAMTDLREARPADEAPLGRTDTEPDLALDLAETSPDVLHYTLREIYNESGRLDAEALGLVPSLLQFLDVDGDGAVDVREISRLDEAPPSLVLTVDFGSDLPQERQPKVAVSAIADELSAAGVSVQERPGQVDVELPGGGLELSAADVGRAQIVDVPALFSRLDADKSGLLEAAEQQQILGATNLLLAEIDRDADGKLSLDECQKGVADSQPFSTVQAQASIARAADALFTCLDEQRDGRLTSREIRGAPRRLAALDRDGDGQVTPDEIPPRLTFVVSRGAQGRIEGMMPRGRPSPPQGPGWMTAMDRNRDGEVSPREFLGTRDQFSQLDADGDGFLSAEEANAAASGDP